MKESHPFAHSFITFLTSSLWFCTRCQGYHEKLTSIHSTNACLRLTLFPPELCIDSFIKFLTPTLVSVLDTKHTIMNHTEICPFVQQMLIEHLLCADQNNSVIHSTNISWEPILCLSSPSSKQDRCGPCSWRGLQSYLCGQGFRGLGVQKRETILDDGTDRLQGSPEGLMGEEDGAAASLSSYSDPIFNCIPYMWAMWPHVSIHGTSTHQGQGDIIPFHCPFLVDPGAAFSSSDKFCLQAHMWLFPLLKHHHNIYPVHPSLLGILVTPPSLAEGTAHLITTLATVVKAYPRPHSRHRIQTSCWLSHQASSSPAPALLQELIRFQATTQGFCSLFLSDQADFFFSYSLKVLFLAQLLEMLWFCSEPKCYSLQIKKKKIVKTAASHKIVF